MLLLVMHAQRGCGDALSELATRILAIRILSVIIVELVE